MLNNLRDLYTPQIVARRCSVRLRKNSPMAARDLAREMERCGIPATSSRSATFGVGRRCPISDMFASASCESAGSRPVSAAAVHVAFIGAKRFFVARWSLNGIRRISAGYRRLFAGTERCMEGASLHHLPFSSGCPQALNYFARRFELRDLSALKRNFQCCPMERME